MSLLDRRTPRHAKRPLAAEPERTPGRFTRVILPPLGIPGLGGALWVEDTQDETPGVTASETPAAPRIPEGTYLISSAAEQEAAEAEMAAGRAELMAKVTGITPQPAQPPDEEIVRRFARDVQNFGEPQQDTPPPSAVLRSVSLDGHQARYPLSLAPIFAGIAVARDGRPVVAGMHIGINNGRRITLDVTSPAWCDDAITALKEMRDALIAARDETAQDSEQPEEGDAA